MILPPVKVCSSPTGTQATSADGPSSIRIARGTQFWTGNRRADWKVASRFVNMVRLLPLGAYPSGACLGNPRLLEVPS